MEAATDDEYETEETYVYVDFDSKLLDEQLSDADTKIKFLGMHTAQPIMQLNNQLFKGHYDYALGTNCFFKESKRLNETHDACFYEMPSKPYEYLTKSQKILKMSRIFVEEDAANSAEADATKGIDGDLEQLKITKSYTEALNQFLQPDQMQPRQIDELPRHQPSERQEQLMSEAGPSPPS